MAKRQHFVTFYSPGTFMSEQTDMPCESWEPREAVRKAKKVKERYSATPYGFRFETALVADPVPDGEGGTLQVLPKTIKKSGVYFLGGTLLTLREVVERNLPDEKILADNMRSNWPIVCVNTNSWRSTMPFNEEDCIVDDQGNVIERGDDPRHVAYRAEVAAARKTELDQFTREHSRRGPTK